MAKKPIDYFFINLWIGWTVLLIWARLSQSWLGLLTHLQSVGGLAGGWLVSDDLSWDGLSCLVPCDFSSSSRAAQVCFYEGGRGWKAEDSTVSWSLGTTHSHFPPHLLAIGSHKPSPDTRGGEIDSTPLQKEWQSQRVWIQLRKNWGHFHSQSITPTNRIALGS